MPLGGFLDFVRRSRRSFQWSRGVGVFMHSWQYKSRKTREMYDL